MQANLYEKATIEELRLQNIFFRRIKLMRMRLNLGLDKLANNMKSQGCTLTKHALDKYERKNNKQAIRFKTLLMYSEYFDKPLSEMIQPLSEEEERELSELRKKYIPRTEHIIKNRTSKPRV